MGKRQTRSSSRKTTDSKKAKETEEAPSTSIEEESTNVSEDLLPITEEKTVPDDELFPIGSTTGTTVPSEEVLTIDTTLSVISIDTTNSKDIAESAELVKNTPKETNPSSKVDLDHPDRPPGEFVFAPIFFRTGNTLSETPSTSREPKEQITLADLFSKVAKEHKRKTSANTGIHDAERKRKTSANTGNLDAERKRKTSANTVNLDAERKRKTSANISNFDAERKRKTSANTGHLDAERKRKTFLNTSNVEAERKRKTSANTTVNVEVECKGIPATVEVDRILTTANTVSVEVSQPETIEIIDVDELPDRPSCSSIGDDIIEITPSNSPPHGSRANYSPEVIVNKHVVDLTEIGDADDVEVDCVGGTEIDTDGEDNDLILSLWSSMQERKPGKKRKATSPSEHQCMSQCNCSDTDKQSYKISIVKNKGNIYKKSASEEEAASNTDEPEPSSSNSQKLSCPICMDSYSEIKQNRQLMSTSCGHVFCNTCVKAAVNAQKRCPTCRKKLSLKNLHPIFI